MITPSENEQNYRVSVLVVVQYSDIPSVEAIFVEPQDSSVLYRASHLSDVDYLLIHGTGDGKLLK